MDVCLAKLALQMAPLKDLGQWDQLWSIASLYTKEFKLITGSILNNNIHRLCIDIQLLLLWKKVYSPKL